MEDGYWKRARWSRRGVLRGAGVGLAGLAGAVLVGCGGDGGESGSASSTGGGGSGAATAGNSPVTVKRAPGFDPALGLNPVNDKKYVKGGVFRRHFTDTSRQQDPDVSAAGSDHETTNDRLAYANPWTMEIVPDMLEKYELVDPTTLVLKIRPGIKTHNIAPVNGRVFTAQDVAYSINRKAGKVDADKAKAYPRRDQFVGLDKVEAVDDVTVKLTFTKPNGSIMAAFADPRAQMIPREQDDIGYKDVLKAVGTGAFVQTEHVEGTRQVFKPFADYYRKAEEAGRPLYDAYEKLVIADRASVISQFITGEISMITTVTPTEEPTIKAAVRDAQWYGSANLGWYHQAFNKRVVKAFEDPRVVKALRMAIDYKAVADPQGQGWLYSGPLHVMFPEALKSDEMAKLPGYNPATKQQDIAEAARLMEAAGYKDGTGLAFKNNISGPPSGISYENAVRLKDQWAKIWPRMDMTIVPVADFGAFTALLTNKEYEARTYHHTMVPDAALDARLYYHSKGSRNYQLFESAAADTALDKMLEATTLEARKQAIRQFQLDYIETGGPLLQLYVARDNFALQSNWAGFDFVNGTWGYSTYGVGPRWYWQTEK
ncbi:MAG: ABC transporter substrate-binding protein [Dehalococcoidia bacterium]|nr:ABC transporter substrate-binding protein [Dehalococcoidia bacterium]